MGTIAVNEIIRTAIKFIPHLEERVWGGRRLADLGRELPADIPIGESWEISAIAGRSSVVSSGVASGVTFEELLATQAESLIGDAPVPAGAVFPLLLKLLDSSTPLSVQLHPRDAEAVAIEGEGDGSVGKTEAWVVLEATPGARIIHGLAAGVDPETLYQRLGELNGDALRDQEQEDLFRWVPVARGDVVFVPAGTVHALGAGVVLMEIQQSSDLTYRLYDWGRRDAEGASRELHIDKSRRVALRADVPCPWTSLSDDASGVRQLIECEQFRLQDLNVSDTIETTTEDEHGRSFHILFGWSGVSEFVDASGGRLRIEPHDVVLVPAIVGEYQIEPVSGDARCLRMLGGAAS